MSSKGTPKLTVCPMSPVGPGVCATAVSSPSSMWLHEMGISSDRITVLSSLKELVVMAVPNMFAFVASFAVNMITFVCLSMMDDAKLLGAVGLGSLIGNIFGFAIGIGLTSVLDTLVSQAVGARNHELAVVHLNRARIISLVVTLPCFYLMWITEPLLLITKQDPETSALAGLFVEGLAWGLLPYFLCNALNSFARSYGKTAPALVINVGTSIVHGFLSFWIVNKLGHGAYGAGLSISMTYWLRWIMTELSMLFYSETRRAMRWTPSSLKWTGIVSYMTLACSNSVLLWIEWISYELQALLAGWVGTEGLASHVAGANVVTAVFMMAIGLSQSTAALVGISLGKRKPNTAKSFASVSMGFTAVLYGFVCVGIIAWRDGIASLISSDPIVIDTLHNLLIVVGVFSIVDALNGVGEGVLRGLGLQSKAVIFKMIGMLAVRLPVGYLLSLRVGVSGIWIGAILGMSVGCTAIGYIMTTVDFNECSVKALQIQEDEKTSGLLEPLNGRRPDSPLSETHI